MEIYPSRWDTFGIFFSIGNLVGLVGLVVSSGDLRECYLYLFTPNLTRLINGPDELIHLQFVPFGLNSNSIILLVFLSS